MLFVLLEGLQEYLNCLPSVDGKDWQDDKKGGFNYVCFVHLKITSVGIGKDNVIRLVCSWCHNEEFLCKSVI